MLFGSACCETDWPLLSDRPPEELNSHFSDKQVRTRLSLLVPLILVLWGDMKNLHFIIFTAIFPSWSTSVLETRLFLCPFPFQIAWSMVKLYSWGGLYFCCRIWWPSLLSCLLLAFSFAASSSHSHHWPDLNCLPEIKVLFFFHGWLSRTWVEIAFQAIQKAGWTQRKGNCPLLAALSSF